MLSHQDFVSERIDGKRNYGEPIKPDNTQKWQRQMSRERAQRIEEIAYETLQIYGYEVTSAVAHAPISRWELRRGRVRDLAALVLVGNRARRRNGIVERCGDLAFEVGKWLRRGP
jgi:hypothetical protein